jgi:dynein heavy chain, axonemal
MLCLSKRAGGSVMQCVRLVHLCCRAMFLYHNVAKGVAPKRAALKAAQDDLAETMQKLSEAQAKLKMVEEKIATLEAQFEEATAKKQALARQVGV